VHVAPSGRVDGLGAAVDEELGALPDDAGTGELGIGVLVASVGGIPVAVR